MERTLAIIKPDAVSGGSAPFIIHEMLKNGFKVLAYKEEALTKSQACEFYAVHKKMPFFENLTDFMSEGTSFVLVLERDDAIYQWRELMKKLRKQFGTTITRNAVHGSDGLCSAHTEINLMFPEASYSLF